MKTLYRQCFGGFIVVLARWGSTGGGSGLAITVFTNSASTWASSRLRHKPGVFHYDAAFVEE